MMEFFKFKIRLGLKTDQKRRRHETSPLAESFVLHRRRKGLRLHVDEFIVFFSE